MSSKSDIRKGMKNQGYTANDITVLEGLDPVRIRPGMYIGGTDTNSLHHLIWEALDNSVDEAINGNCDEITVNIEQGGYISVEDNGRGIPVDIHPKFKKPAIEIIMTTLHSGAKFSDKVYYSSGGLHGVGISVVNALSEDTTVEVYRDGCIYFQNFSRGFVAGKLENRGKTKKHGTKIRFLPDKTIFPKIEFNKNLILRRAETKAFLNSGLKIIVSDEIENKKETFLYPNGIKDYLQNLIGNKNRLLGNMFHFVEKGKIHIEIALNWIDTSESKIYSYANSVYTKDGGAHDNGLRSALTKVLRDWIQRSAGKNGKGITITSDDVKDGLIAVLSIFLPNPQFQGQTKEKLNNQEAQYAVENLVRREFDRFLLENPASSDLIVERVLLAARARLASREAKENVMRKTPVTKRLTLPGKLADCSSTKVEETELFIVEGNSAGGSTKQARNRHTQAVLPIRGKILNIETATAEQIANNAEIKALEQAIGAGLKENFSLEKLRYGKIIVMTDADVDGAHISLLLLTFFFRFMIDLIKAGRLYIAQPPLYRLEVGKKIHYLYNDEMLQKTISTLGENQRYELFRYKGIGEMPNSILKSTTMDKDTRHLLKVKLTDFNSTGKLLQKLMGKDPKERYDFIVENSARFASTTDELDI